MVTNVYETELPDGTKVGFKCGSYAIAIACREAKVDSIQELFAKMADQDLLAIIALFYGAACQYKLSQKQEVDISPDTVSDWIEAMGEEKANKATLVLLETLKPKNVQAPTTEGANK